MPFGSTNRTFPSFKSSETIVNGRLADHRQGNTAGRSPALPSLENRRQAVPRLALRPGGKDTGAAIVGEEKGALIKVIVFDFDGTLFDTRRDIADAVNHARRSYGLRELTLDEVTPMVGWGVRKLAEQAFADTGIRTEEALKRIMEYYDAHPGDRSVLYPGVRETLPKLQATRVIVSNKPVHLIRSILEEHHLTPYFDYVIGGDSFSAQKPDPFPIRFLQARYHVGTHEILVVGDHAPDIEMARRAGCPSVFCRYGFFGKDEVGADYSIDRFAELEPLVKRLREQEGSSGSDVSSPPSTKPVG